MMDYFCCLKPVVTESCYQKGEDPADHMDNLRQLTHSPVVKRRDSPGLCRSGSLGRMKNSVPVPVKLERDYVGCDIVPIVFRNAFNCNLQPNIPPKRATLGGDIIFHRLGTHSEQEPGFIGVETHPLSCRLRYVSSFKEPKRSYTSAATATATGAEAGANARGRFVTPLHRSQSVNRPPQAACHHAYFSQARAVAPPLAPARFVSSQSNRSAANHINIAIRPGPRALGNI